MHLKRRLLTLTAAGGMAMAAGALTAPVHAFAGYGSSQNCGDQNSATNWTGQFGQADDFPILGGPYSLDPGSPVTVGAEVSTNYGPHGALCYSTSPYGTPGASGGAVTVDVLSTFPAWSNPNENAVNVGCANDPGGVVEPECLAAANPSITFTPAAAPAQGGTYTATIPFTVCFGTNLTGGCSPSLNGPVNIATTGVIVAAATTAAPSGTNEGAGLQLDQGTLWLAGIPFNFAPPANAAAGVGTQSAEAHPNNSTPLCVLNGFCPNVPTGAGVAFTGTQDVYSISFAGINETYNPGYFCIVDSPGGATC